MFQKQLKLISALAITGAIRGTSTEERYNELGLEALEKRRWYRKLCCFYKLYKSHSPKYLFNIIPVTMSNSESLNVFKNSLLKFICPSGNSVFNCHNPRGVKLLTRLRLGLGHL